MRVRGLAGFGVRLPSMSGHLVTWPLGSCCTRCAMAPEACPAPADARYLQRQALRDCSSQVLRDCSTTFRPSFLG
jgi:hypothetical protein